MNRINKIEIKGYKSLKDVTIDPGAMNVLIGANGTGKSNFLTFFRMLSWIMARNPKLQEYVTKIGNGANRILFDGAEVTPFIETNLELETDSGINEYSFKLVYAADDTLLFTDEKFRFSSNLPTFTERARWQQLGAGHRESKLHDAAETGGNPTARTIRMLLQEISFYQFHNTSFTSRMRTLWSRDENHNLKEDGANLATFLCWLLEEHPSNYRMIVRTIQTVYPLFDDFVFDSSNSILLKWKELDSDYTFSASQASDGLLRTFALVALLSQPPENLPDVVMIDEPELGLHPYAISIVAGLMKTVAQHSQLFVATQSADLLNEFSANEVVVVDRVGRETTMRKLSEEQLKEWLDEYTLAELWKKNIFGGGPR